MGDIKYLINEELQQFALKYLKLSPDLEESKSKIFISQEFQSQDPLSLSRIPPIISESQNLSQDLYSQYSIARLFKQSFSQESDYLSNKDN